MPIDLTTRAPLIAVIGGPGSGASTVAAATAQALGGHRSAAGPVVLADLALDARQGVCHGADELATGLGDLLRQPRGRRSSGAALAATIAVPRRGYRLLVGLREHGDWVSVRPPALDAVLDDLRRSAGAVVVEVDVDLEGEASTGSFDIEDRNRLARTTVRRADVVLATCAATRAGKRDASVLLRELAGVGVAAGRTVLIVTRGPVRTRWDGGPSGVVAGQLRYRRATARSAESGRPLPRAVVRPLARTVVQALDCAGRLPAPPTHDEPVRIVPGEIGHWPA